MTCPCACHDAGWVPCCPYCAETASPTHYTVTPDNMEAFCTEAKMVAVPEHLSYKLTFVATPQLDDLYKYGTDHLQQYGVAVAVSTDMMAHDYLGTLQQAKMLAAKEWNNFFGKNGMPGWIKDALKKWYDVNGQAGQLTMGMIQEAKATIQQSYNTPGLLPADYISGQTVVGDLVHLLPGLQEIVACPAKVRWLCTPCSLKGVVCLHGQDEKHRVRCSEQMTIQRMIVHLNDGHRWARETEIADWLETLDIDLSFPAEAPPRPEPRPRAAGEMAMMLKEVYKAQIDKYTDVLFGHSTLLKEVGHDLQGNWVKPKLELTPKALALQAKMEQGKQNGKFAVNPTKTRRKKNKEH